MDPVGPGDPFGAHMLADIVRLLLGGGGVFLVMLCIKLAWMRARSPQGDPVRERSPIAIFSYAAFAIVPTGNAIQWIGHEPDWGLLAWFAMALVTGIWGAFGQVTLHLWTGRSKPTGGRNAPPAEPEHKHG